MEEAENATEVVETQPAETQQAEPSIPKHRLDEVLAHNRSLQEQIRFTQEALEMTRAQFRAPPQDDTSEYEAAGFDQNQIRAVGKLIEKKAMDLAQPLRGAVGALANKVEEQEFLLEFGKDKSKYLTKIREMKKAYAAQGMPLNVEMAYKMIRVDELDSKPAAQRAEVKPEPKVQAAPPPVAKPSAKLTKTMEELEAELEEGFRTHGSI